jgi:predicted AlkP superfamily phosphohydrolase/phosphomutase
VRGKILIIALDGATLTLIEPWARAGYLPNLWTLMEEGCYGPLESVIPPVTGAAWSSFQTGLLPGRHGVFDWLTRREERYDLRVIDSHRLHGVTIWEWLSAQGARVGALSVPGTYPARPLNGFMITDLLTPASEPYLWPAELQPQLERAIGGRYPVMPPHWRGRHEVKPWLAGLKRSLGQRARAAHHLLTHQPWDLFMVHFMETDTVQHQMWHLIDGQARPRYRAASPKTNPVLEIYRLADEAIGKLIAALPQPDDTTVLVISDHGFGPLHYNLHLNTWLLQQGYLKLKNSLPSRFKRLAFRLGITPENLYPWEERLRLLKVGQAFKEDQSYRLLRRFFLSAQNVDWKRTVAYSYGNVGQIYLNRIGREPQGCVPAWRVLPLTTEIVEALRAFTNPYTGEAVAETVYRREEIYTERALASGPEIVFLPSDGYTPLGLSEFLANRPVSLSVAHSGWHRMEGVLLGRGDALRRGRLSNLRLLDLFPTVNHLMGLPSPADLDGQVSASLIRQVPALAGTHARHHTNGAHHVPRPGAALAERSLAEEEELRARLKGLGYL